MTIPPEPDFNVSKQETAALSVDGSLPGMVIGLVMLLVVGLHDVRSSVKSAGPLTKVLSSLIGATPLREASTVSSRSETPATVSATRFALVSSISSLVGSSAALGMNPARVLSPLVGTVGGFTRTFDGVREFAPLVGFDAGSSLGPDIIRATGIGALDATMDPLFQGSRIFSPRMGVVNTFQSSLAGSFSTVRTAILGTEGSLSRTFTGYRAFSARAAIGSARTATTFHLHSVVGGCVGELSRTFDGVRMLGEVTRTAADSSLAPDLVRLSTFGAIDATVDPRFTGTRIFEAVAGVTDEFSSSLVSALTLLFDPVIGTEGSFSRLFTGTRSFAGVMGTVAASSLGPDVLRVAAVGAIDAVIDPVFTGVREFSPIVGVVDETVSTIAGEILLVVESLVAPVDDFGRTFTGLRAFAPVVGVVPLIHRTPFVTGSSVSAVRHQAGKTTGFLRVFSPRVGLHGSFGSTARVARSLGEAVGLVESSSRAVTRVSSATMGIVWSVSDVLESGMVQVLDATVGLVESVETAGTFTRVVEVGVGLLYGPTMSEAVAHALAAVEVLGGTTTLARGPTTTRTALAGTATSIRRETSRVLSPLLASATRLTFPSRLQQTFDVVVSAAPSVLSLKAVLPHVSETGKLHATVAAGKLQAAPEAGKLYVAVVASKLQAIPVLSKFFADTDD